MNFNPVISLPSADADGLLPFRRVKMTSSGADYADEYDRCIGMTVPGDLNREQAAVQVLGIYAEAVLGSGTDVAAGDELEAAADGKVIKKNTGNAIGVAVTGATEDGDRLDVIYYGDATPTEAPAT